MDNKTEKKIPVRFAAIDRFVESNIITPEEKADAGSKFIKWGDYNIYPQYLFNLYRNCPTLQTLVNGCADYTVGDGCESKYMSAEKTEDIVRQLALEYFIYGGFSINVLRNKLRKIAAIDVIDIKNIRSDEKNEVFFYSPDFSKSKSVGRCRTTQHYRFTADNDDILSSVFFYKNSPWTTYPLPIWASATKAAEMEKDIAEYQLNNIHNGFQVNTVIAFNNGIPNDEDKEEIEEAINEKFTGYENASRPLITYSDDKDHGVEVLKLTDESYVDKYKSAAEKSRQDLFTAFRANPVLFGINMENKGFSDNDFQESFKLFNRTVIKPVQKIICNAFDRIYGEQGVLTIKPFTIDFGDNKEENDTVE